jgi:hypothetical protein
MYIRRSHFIALATSFLLLANAPAQQEKISLQFLAFPKQMRPEPIELVVGEGKTIEVDTPGNELSSAYKVPPLSSVMVGKTTTDGEGEPVFEVYGKGKGISATKQIILLIRKGKESSDGFVVIPINAEQANFAGGSFLFINASALNVGGTIGDKKFALKPGQQKLVTPKADHEGDICQVTISYQRDEKWKTFYDTRWPANKTYRSLIFFHQDPETGRLGIAPIVDMQME